jgi:L-aspartate oxidase
VLEGGHSHNRIVHAADMTGKEIERALLKAVINNPNIDGIKCFDISEKFDECF